MALVPQGKSNKRCIVEGRLEHYLAGGEADCGAHCCALKWWRWWEKAILV